LGIPKRTRGRLGPAPGGLVFAYRRFLVFPRVLAVGGETLIGRRILAPSLVAEGPDGRLRELFVFRLKLKSGEEAIRLALGLSRVETVGALGAARKAWAWLKALVSRAEPELAIAPASGPSGAPPPLPAGRPLA
jgi:hypothetical protein